MVRRHVLRVLIACLLVLLVAAIILHRLFWHPPSWYDPPSAADPAATRLAEQVEHRLAEEVHRIREPSETWRLRIRDHQINSWLAIRLPKWFERETGRIWPDAIGTPQVRFLKDIIQLVLPIHFEHRMHTFVAEVQPTFTDEQTTLTAPVTRISHGRLPLPGDPHERIKSLIDERVPEHLLEDDMLALALDALSGESVEWPTFTLQDGRVVEIIDFSLGSGTLDITVRTIAAGDVGE